ncbi:MAG TPA: diacylglycerol kinase family protein [Longimicrobium sp.]|jgi:diacylglycerol kinase family enzyme|uniref:diacylglycerol/lipid kinase family protein n=1 Tax=Longimicrobium sp. TaxID=2029185 RepID=UPI002ED94B57
MRRALLIVNPAAGQWWRRPDPERLRDRLATHGWAVDLHLTRGQDHATEIVREHLHGAEAVWVCGGDGTVGQAVAGMVDSGIPVAILPAGTVNVVAAECGIPKRLDRAMAALSGDPRRCPFRIWQMNGRAVILGAGVGFDARAMGRTPLSLKHALGLLAIGARGIREWARYDFPALRVTGTDGDGNPFDEPATQVLATVTRRFAGSHTLVPDADPADDCIELVLLRGVSRARLAAFWMGVELPGAAQLRVPGVRVLRAREFRVTREGPAEEEAHVNGDVVAATPFSVEPWGRVDVLAPRRGS